ncbi:MAG: ribonuclease Z [Nitrososphaerota archaeon]|uniref:ribonuclease Z n=1 Tax=Candidatus Bathycorpusculum sp. TaxID=2994959 RepID=UPI0028323C60|nr:ribonuclease Z [Candidatus Termiticorpusculum sp.]MCL2292129.1 ribonuclease Z [Candidatus Termiticorpusculum sp.]MDR0461459.1 ribonuclease Z [Nitrososphaerota archaeon]
MRLIFLGTSAAVPTLKRSLPATVLQCPTEQWIFDCGENTQRQMMASKISFHKKTKIFLTHLHGDHVLGLPGLLQTMALMDRKNPLQVYGPVGIKNFLECCQQTLNAELTYPLEINEVLNPKIIVQEEKYTITAVRANHTIESYSYIFEEKPHIGEFFPEKALALEIPEGELWSKLQKGETITLPNGNTVNPDEVIGPNRPGRKIVYTGDTMPYEDFADFAKDADVIVHDCTFDDALATKAKDNGHSTASQAANQAKTAEAKLLVLTHISARYPYIELLIEQAKKVFENTIMAEDFLIIEIPIKN